VCFFEGEKVAWEKHFIVKMTQESSEEGDRNFTLERGGGEVGKNWGDFTRGGHPLREKILEKEREPFRNKGAAVYKATLWDKNRTNDAPQGRKRETEIKKKVF